MDKLMMLLGDRPDFWLSMVVIVVMLGMGVFFVGFFLRHIREDMRRHQGEPPQGPGHSH